VSVGTHSGNGRPVQGDTTRLHLRLPICRQLQGNADLVQHLPPECVTHGLPHFCLPLPFRL
jgi:hypothetical protein